MYNLHIKEEEERIRRIITTLVSTASVILLSLTGILPVLYTIFYSYFTWSLDIAIFNHQIQNARIALQRSYIARGLLCCIGSSTYLIHLFYIYHQKVKTPKQDTILWSKTNTIELCVALCIFIYGIVLLYFGHI